MRDFVSSFRFSLTVLILLAIIPATGLTIYTATKHRQAVAEAARQEVFSLAHHFSDQQEMLAESTHQLLAGLARLPEVKEKDARACSALLADLIVETPIYATAIVVEPNGDLWCSAIPAEGPVNFADRAWFQETMRTRQFTAGGYVMGRVTRRPMAVFSYPLLNEDGQVQRVLAVGLDLAWLDRYLAQRPLPEGAVLTVLDAQGTVLARTQEAEKWVGQGVPEAEIAQIVLARGVPGTVEALGADGVQRLYAFAPLGAGGYVLVGIPTALVYAEADRLLHGDLIVLGLVTLLVLGAAWAGGEALLVRRVNALLAAARRMAIGDLSARTGISYEADELGQLARAFDEMADSLEKQDRQRWQAEKALRASEARYRALVEGSPDGIAAHQEGKIVFINPAGARLLGAERPEDLLGKPALDFVHPDHRDVVRGRIRRGLEEGQPAPPLEEKFLRLDGQAIDVEVSAAPILYEDRPAMQVVFRDITERKRDEEQIIRQLRTITALYAGARRLTQSLDLEDVAREVCRICVESFGARLAWLGRAEEDGRVKVIAQFPADHPYPRQITVRWDETPEGQGPTGRAIRSGAPEICQDIFSDPRFAAWRPIAERYGFRSSMAFPLISRGHTFGALNLYGGGPDFFTPELVDTFQALTHQAAAALENARLFAEASRRLKQVQALRNIDMAITASLDPRVTLRVLLDEVTAQLGVDAAAVLLLDPHTLTLEYSAGRGFRTRAIEGTRLRLGEGYAGRAALERRVLALDDLPEAEDFLRSRLVREEGFQAYYVAPMVAKGRVLGVLETFHRTPLDGNREWVEMLEALAGQAAIAVENARLFDDLERSNINLRQAYDATIEGWSRALDLRDKETEGHTQRVTELTVTLAREMGMSQEELVHIRRGALLHDMGKMGIPDSVLLKPGPLTEEEWAIMRKHPQYAFEMLSPIEYLRPALDIPYCHHERWDGTGYPRGLKGEQIPLAARIFAVVDVWDALTSDRPYRPAWSKERALTYIKEQADKQFDPRVVEVFLRKVVGISANG